MSGFHGADVQKGKVTAFECQPLRGVVSDIGDVFHPCFGAVVRFEYLPPSPGTKQNGRLVSMALHIPGIIAGPALTVMHECMGDNFELLVFRVDGKKFSDCSFECAAFHRMDGKPVKRRSIHPPCGFHTGENRLLHSPGPARRSVTSHPQWHYGLQVV